ncbi:cellulase family glycosylhydrolase [uncultured Lamprocystis sp.]|uniref:cellulase family glycosylhydrolase n=1 Tax=uncultured Lamprocystis sp. TaxID=543132 RepID=UPI0025D25FD9|nr:cellulase family glycosylhydrolase [uncultured Lamprocystis sp.]
MTKRFLMIFCLLFAMANCAAVRGESDLSSDQTATISQGLPLPSIAVSLVMPIVAAHYFGRHWPKNFIAAFRREYVRQDFDKLRDDGFNTVIFLVSWGDFQPMTEPCCTWDERAFARLHFLIDEAAHAHLKVILRVGYAWSFHPDAGVSSQRIHRLLNEEAVQTAYLSFVRRLASEIASSKHVIMSFMSWEDQWLRQLDPSARSVFDDFASLLPAGMRPVPGAVLPSLDGEGAALFNAYWDWLVMYRLFEPSRQILPNLSYEIRVDKDPDYQTNQQGEHYVAAWLDHRAMYRQRGRTPVTIYYAPYWGAENIGERLTADRATTLFTALLDETRRTSDYRDIFIDQFNLVDNTPGHENNAIIEPGAIDNFLKEAVCTMKNRGVIGYGYWTTRDYRESPLYNPSFSYGLDGWRLTLASAPQVPAALVSLGNGDVELRMVSGDTLTQTVTAAVGRLPATDARPDRVCVEASAEAESSILVHASQEDAPVRLHFASGTLSEQCADIVSTPVDDRLTLRIHAETGAALRLRGVWLFDHTQIGGLYDTHGLPGSSHGALVRFNHEFSRTGLPANCNP